jgi:hypothetical protein
MAAGRLWRGCVYLGQTTTENGACRHDMGGHEGCYHNLLAGFGKQSEHHFEKNVDPVLKRWYED